MTRYFFDTEFNEDGKTIELISIGIKAEDGREFYAVSTEFEPSRCNDWVVANVLPHLPPAFEGTIIGDYRLQDMDGRWQPRSIASHSLETIYADRKAACTWMPRYQIAQELKQFVLNDSSKPEFWAYYADYDWVALCQLFGPMVALPKGFPKFCLDLKQQAYLKGNPTLPIQSSTEHHALADANWNEEVYNFLFNV